MATIIQDMNLMKDGAHTDVAKCFENHHGHRLSRQEIPYNQLGYNTAER